MMHLKNDLKNVFLALIAIIVLQTPLLSTQCSNGTSVGVEAFASLLFHVQELMEESEEEISTLTDKIQFTEDEIAALWNKAMQSIESEENGDAIKLLNDACELYTHAALLKTSGLVDEAQESFARCSILLNKLWEEAIESEESAPKRTNLAQSVLRSKSGSDPNLEKNRYLPSDAKKKMRPYLLPFHHPVRSFIDSLCLNQRITVDQKTFEKAGFHVLATGPRSYISVASHPEMPRYLVKVYFDTVLAEKRDKASWKWLVLRCEGAEKIETVIRDKEIRNFKVAKKWIYCLPPEPSPPKDDLHSRHFALLVVTDMNLVSENHNYFAWKHYITEEHLDELYLIISRAKGSSYRPDNISYTKKGTFAFIDTEYPGKGPDFKSIRNYLNSDMKKYWDRIVKNGGP